MPINKIEVVQGMIDSGSIWEDGPYLRAELRTLLALRYLTITTFTSYEMWQTHFPLA